MVGQQQQAPRAELVEPVDEGGEDAPVPRLERLHLLLEVPGVAGLVRGLHVNDEQVGAVRERAQGGVALPLVVGVVPPGGAGHLDDLDVGEHPEAPDEVDGGAEAGLQPVGLGERRHHRLRALTPQPDLGRRVQELAHDGGAGVHERAEVRRGGARGPHDRLVRQVVGRGAVGLRPRTRRHHDVAVLEAGVEGDLVRAEHRLEGGDDPARVLGGGVAAGEVAHGAVGTDVDQVAAERHLVRRELDAERRRLDRGTAGVEPAGVVAEDAHVADVTARRQAFGDHRRPAHVTAPGEGGEGRQVGRLEGRAPTELGERLVGAPVGHAHHVLRTARLHDPRVGPERGLPDAGPR